MSRLILIAAACAMTTAAEAGEPVILTRAGADLGRASSETLRSTIEARLDISLGPVEAAYAVARFQNNQPLMRTADGSWVPWSGRDADLVQTTVITAEGTVTFTGLDAPDVVAFTPAALTIGYVQQGVTHWGTLVVDGP